MANTSTPDNRLRVRLQEILLLKRRLQELIDQLKANFFGLAAVDPAGALDGDGSAGDPLAVRVDGVTVTINGSNQLEATGGGTPSDTVEDLDGTGDAGASTDYSRGDHKHADTNRPTDAQKAALAGTGTPSGANKFVTADTLAAAITAPAAHHTTHENGGTDEISVTGLSGLLADPQTPTGHHTSHENGGGDAIKLDDLATPDDNTDLNASTSRHGLLRKLDNNPDHFLNGQGNWVPFDSGSPGSPDNLLDDTEYPIKFTLDGGGADISTGLKNYTALIPPVGYAGTIVEWQLHSPDTGSITINVRKNGSSITSTHDPALSAASDASDTDLSDWSAARAVVGGDRISINVTACSGITFAELQMIVVRT